MCRTESYIHELPCRVTWTRHRPRLPRCPQLTALMFSLGSLPGQLWGKLKGLGRHFRAPKSSLDVASIRLPPSRLRLPFGYNWDGQPPLVDRRLCFCCAESDASGWGVLVCPGGWWRSLFVKALCSDSTFGLTFGPIAVYLHCWRILIVFF